MNELQKKVLTVIKLQQALNVGIKAGVNTEVTPEQAKDLLWYIDHIESKLEKEEKPVKKVRLLDVPEVMSLDELPLFLERIENGDIDFESGER